MYRIMLAEDEQEVLQAMLRTIRWEKHGFEPPVGCRDGRDAIARLEEGFAPDVLITDICMPFVDGLELTRYINEHLPNTVVVVLTGYDDFSYAQNAIKLQVYDYLLKPVTPMNINELLDRLREQLESRGANVIERALQIAGSHFLNRLVTKRLDSSVIKENCRLHKFGFTGRYHIAAALDVDLPTPVTIDDNNNLELMRYGLFNIAQELTEKSPETIVFQGNDGRTNLLADADDRDGAYEAANRLTALIAQTVCGGLKITVSAGIGEPVAYLDELHLSHAQAVTALGYRFFYGEASIICAADIDIKKSGEIDYAACERQFEAAVKTQDLQKALQAVGELTDQLKDNHIAFDKCVLYTQKLAMRLINLTTDMIGEQEMDTLEKTWEESNFYQAPTLARLEDMLRELCGKVFQMFELVKSDTAATQVMKAEAYIRDHYSDPNLSLNAITEHLAISTSYFSAIFKSKTGSTFVEYLTRVRMDRAKQILEFTDRRTYEAADDVGFSDPHYFSVAFKRSTGMTPKEYRECCVKRGEKPE